MKDFIKDYIYEALSLKEKIISDEEFITQLENISQILINAYKNNKKVLVAGNGGSAADAQHFVGELVSKLFFDRKPLNAIALNANTSVITAIGNDYGFEDIFSRQLEANACEGDVFVAISTSGNSPNIIKALQTANELGIISIGFTGANNSKMDSICNHLIKVPSSITPQIQEIHIMIIHIISALVEKNLFGN